MFVAWALRKTRLTSFDHVRVMSIVAIPTSKALFVHDCRHDIDGMRFVLGFRGSIFG